MNQNFEKIIPIWLETIEAFFIDSMINDYFAFLQKLSKNDYEIHIYRNGDNKPAQIIKDSDHMTNFINHYRKTIGVR